jgi:DNA-binding PadR family transcriptional regulator
MEKPSGCVTGFDIFFRRLQPFIRDLRSYICTIVKYIYNLFEMRELSVPEEILLTAIWRLKEDAYGVTIRKKVEEVTGRDIAYGTLYNILAQLTRKGYVTKAAGPPTPERGGRRKIYYSVTRSGVKVLEDARELHRRIWDRLPDLADSEK